MEIPEVSFPAALGYLGHRMGIEGSVVNVLDLGEYVLIESVELSKRNALLRRVTPALARTAAAYLHWYRTVLLIVHLAAP